MTCCQLLKDNDESSFSRTLATGYYDGPTEGFCECAACSRVFSMQMFQWDSDQDWRVIAFAELPLSFDEIALLLSVERTGKGSCILVSPLVEPQNSILRRLFARTPHWVGMISGWPGRIGAWRKISGVDPATVRDWFDFLGRRT